jgi:hypothetical protein
MGKFRTPRRRTTRQRSGFGVAGKKTGSTCKIENSILVVPHNDQITFSSDVARKTARGLFTKNRIIVGAGCYLQPQAAAKCSLRIEWQCDGQPRRAGRPDLELEPDIWNRVGLLDEADAGALTATITDARVKVNLTTRAPVSVFGLMLSSVDNEYFVDHDVDEQFHIKLKLQIPEILYVDPTLDALAPDVSVGSSDTDGALIVCKSCNRCARFFPINIKDERKTLSFSNHCVSRAPCTHSSFSTYRIDAGGPAEIGGQEYTDVVQAHYGHQLECISCKKFFVNLPLNPLRNSTQHREDALRRRALEVLVRELLGHDWIYHEHRMNLGTEFDVHIWEQFGKACFNCGTTLDTPNDMDLDHTLPLAYLWPLDSTATCLCPTCNSSKSDKFPIEFYKDEQLPRLAELTGLAVDTLHTSTTVALFSGLTVWYPCVVIFGGQGCSNRRFQGIFLS